MAGEIVWGGVASADWEREGVVVFDSLLLQEYEESEQDEPDPDDSGIIMSESATRVDSFCPMRQEDQ